MEKIVRKRDAFEWKGRRFGVVVWESEGILAAREVPCSDVVRDDDPQNGECRGDGHEDDGCWSDPPKSGACKNDVLSCGDNWCNGVSRGMSSSCGFPETASSRTSAVNVSRETFTAEERAARKQEAQKFVGQKRAAQTFTSQVRPAQEHPAQSFVLVHGFAQDASAWEEVAEEILRVAQVPTAVYAFELMGHGSSDCPRDEGARVVRAVRVASTSHAVRAGAAAGASANPDESAHSITDTAISPIVAGDVSNASVNSDENTHTRTDACESPRSDTGIGVAAGAGAAADAGVGTGAGAGADAGAGAGVGAVADAYALKFQAEALLAFCASVAVGVSVPVLVGYSMGGRVAVEAAVEMVFGSVAEDFDPAIDPNFAGNSDNPNFSNLSDAVNVSRETFQSNTTPSRASVPSRACEAPSSQDTAAFPFSALVLESAGLGPTSSEERREVATRNGAWAKRVREEGVAAFMDYWESLPLFASQRALPPATRERVREARLRNDAEALACSFEYAGAHTMHRRACVLTALDALGSAGVPVRYLAGELDAKYRALAQEVKASGIKVETQTIPGVGHNAHLENPAAFVRAAFIPRC